MKEVEPFYKEMRKELDAAEEVIEHKTLPEIRDLYNKFHNAFNSIYKMLITKKTIMEDPYSTDTKISEVTIPDSTPFTESERGEKMAIRLASLNLQLDFLLNYYQFSLEFINFTRLKNMVGITKYIDWLKFTENSSKINTRALASMVFGIKVGSDKITQEIINDALKQLYSTTKEILLHLKKAMDFMKERYKNDVRGSILIPQGIHSCENKKEVMRYIKQHFNEFPGDEPFYSTLIDELLEDDFSSDSENIHNQRIKLIEVKKTKAVQKKPTEEYKKIILDGLRTLGNCNLTLESSIKKLGENVVLLETRPMSFGEKFRLWLQAAFRRSREQTRVYEIEIFDYLTNRSKEVKLEFNGFSVHVMKQVKLLSAFTNKMSQKYQDFKEMEEESLYQIFTRHIEDVNKSSIKMDALDTYFKTEIPKEMRHRIRGIKTDLSSIKGTLAKAREFRGSYISKKEEEEQFKKLGIKLN